MIGLRGIQAWALKWLGIAGAVALAIIGALTFGFIKGKETGASKGDADAAKAKADAATQQAAQAESTVQAEQAASKAASEVQNEVQKLPDAPVQQVGTAAVGTAAHELQQWERDAPPDGHP